MHRQDYFDNIISGSQGDRAIVRVLKARGFLIEEDSGEYYLSDNSDCMDAEYLGKLLEKYSLGSLEGQKKRKECIKDTEPVLVRINQYAEINNAIEAFCDKKRASMEVCTETIEWQKFARMGHGRKVPVAYLEPFVAYYVKAVSACGVDTCFSCDGDHEDGGRIIVRANYPYSLWHRAIWEYYLGEECPLDGKGLSFSDDDKYDKYYKLYKIADMLYENRVFIRGIKSSICDSIGGRSVFKRKPDGELSEEFIKACGNFEWR